MTLQFRLVNVKENFKSMEKTPNEQIRDTKKKRSTKMVKTRVVFFSIVVIVVFASLIRSGSALNMLFELWL